VGENDPYYYAGQIEIPNAIASNFEFALRDCNRDDFRVTFAPPASKEIKQELMALDDRDLAEVADFLMSFFMSRAIR
jgi:hypothetical protein